MAASQCQQETHKTRRSGSNHCVLSGLFMHGRVRCTRLPRIWIAARWVSRWVRCSSWWGLPCRCTIASGVALPVRVSPLAAILSSGFFGCWRVLWTRLPSWASSRSGAPWHSLPLGSLRSILAASGHCWLHGSPPVMCGLMPRFLLLPFLPSGVWTLLGRV